MNSGGFWRRLVYGRFGCTICATRAPSDSRTSASRALDLNRRVRKYATGPCISRGTERRMSFDVLVEVCRKGASEPYWVWVWVWECKNYGNRVPVDDAEEFHAELEQLGAYRTKGTMIILIGYEPGTVEYAKSNGIGLWRYIPEGSPVCLMEDGRSLADTDILPTLTTPETTGFRFYGHFYGLASSGELTTDRTELIRAELRSSLGPPNQGIHPTAQETGGRVMDGKPGLRLSARSVRLDTGETYGQGA